MATHEQAVAALHPVFLGVIRLLVDDAEAVSIDVSEGKDGAILFSVHVANRSDVGKLIGKQGRTARSLRVILGAASMKFGQRFSLDIDGSPISE